MRGYSGGREGVNDSMSGSRVDVNVGGLRIGFFDINNHPYTSSGER